MARKTYEAFSAKWPFVTGDTYFDAMNNLKRFVASNTLTESTWNTQILKGDVAAQVKNLKKEPGKNILKYGIGDFDKTLLQYRLIDELNLSIIPIALHKGKRIFEGISLEGIALEVKETKVFENGVINIAYTLEYSR